MSSGVGGVAAERMDFSQRLTRQYPMTDERRRNHPEKSVQSDTGERHGGRK